MNCKPLKFALSAIFLLGGLPLAAKTRAPGAVASVLPDSMFGSWALDQNDCSDAESESRLHLTSKAIEFVDNKLNIQRVRETKSGWWRIDGLSQEKSKSRRRPATVELRQTGADRLSLRSGPEKPEEFIRCKPVQLQG